MVMEHLHLLMFLACCTRGFHIARQNYYRDPQGIFTGNVLAGNGYATRNRFDDRRGGGRGRDGMPGCRLMVMCHGMLVVGLHMFTQDAII